MEPTLIEYLLYEPEDNGILWTKFNQPGRMNDLVDAAEENGTVAEVGEYMRVGAMFHFASPAPTDMMPIAL